VALSAPTARAQVVLYSTGFEPPTFAAGQLVGGQDGWIAPFSPTAGAISTSNPRSGLQDLQVSASLLTTLSSGERFGTYGHDLFYDTQAHGTPRIAMRSDVRLDGPSTAGQNIGNPPVRDALATAALVASDGNNSFIGYLSLSSNGYLYTGTRTGHDPYYHEQFPTPVSLGQYYTLGMDLDYAARTITYLVDSRVLGTLPFPNDVSNIFRQATCYFDAWPDPYINNSLYAAHFDNYSVRASAVPEPSGLVLTGLGSLGLLGIVKRGCRRRAGRGDRPSSRD
jgi:hypothetical protein